MAVSTKTILSGAAAIIMVALLTAAWAARNSVPPFNFNPVPKNAPTLNQADIEKVLGPTELETLPGPHRFHVFRRARQVPSAVRQSFANITGSPFDIADPDGPMSSDDITSGAPIRRLVFVGLSDDSAFLVYRQGGFVGTLNVVAFWYGEGGHAWGATLYVGVSDISSLRTAIKQGKYQTWQRFDSPTGSE